MSQKNRKIQAVILGDGIKITSYSLSKRRQIVLGFCPNIEQPRRCGKGVLMNQRNPTPFQVQQQSQTKSTFFKIKTYFWYEACQTSLDLESLKDTIDQEIQESDVILLFYDLTNKKSIDRLNDYWLPRIHKIKKEVPVIVIGNKQDLLEQGGDYQYGTQRLNHKISKVLVPLIKEYKQVEMGLETSALIPKNMKDIIFCLQRAVLFPLAPLYSLTNKDLDRKFKKALTLIFRVFDKDLNDCLNDNELNNLQSIIFHGELGKSDIKAIKDVISEQDVKIPVKRKEIPTMSTGHHQGRLSDSPQKMHRVDEDRDLLDDAETFSVYRLT